MISATEDRACIESDLGLEVAAAFREMVDEGGDRSNWQAHLKADYKPFAKTLVAGEWDRIGTNPDLSLYDLALLAEIWGSALIPLPFVPTMAAVPLGEGRRAGLTSIALPGLAGDTVVPYANDGLPVASGRTIAVGAVSIDRTDPFDLNMPVGHGTGEPAADREILRRYAILSAAEAIGCAAEALGRAKLFALDRWAFGRPIVAFQAVRHNLADMYRDVEIGRGALALAIAEPKEIVEATDFIFRRTRAVVEGAIQTHGGMGFTWEVGLHFYLRRVMALSDLTAGLAPRI